MHLLLNETSMEFITSDDPVVIHNQWCEGVTHTGVLGWNARGFQALFPISPSELLVLFDPLIYRVGNSHRATRATIVQNECDVEVFNAFQIHNADENVYFANHKNDGKSAQQCWALTESRNLKRITIMETERVRESETRESNIVGHFETLLPVRLSTSVISVQKRAKMVPLRDRLRMYRNSRPRRPIAETPPDDSPREPIRYPVKSFTKR
jgi:hypothetical protein